MSVHQYSKIQPMGTVPLKHFKDLLLQKQFIDLSGLKRLAQRMNPKNIHAPKIFTQLEEQTKTPESE